MAKNTVAQPATEQQPTPIVGKRDAFIYILRNRIIALEITKTAMGRKKQRDNPVYRKAVEVAACIEPSKLLNIVEIFADPERCAEAPISGFELGRAVIARLKAAQQREKRPAPEENNGR